MVFLPGESLQDRRCASDCRLRPDVCLREEAYASGFVSTARYWHEVDETSRVPVGAGTCHEECTVTQSQLRSSSLTEDAASMRARATVLLQVSRRPCAFGSRRVGAHVAGSLLSPSPRSAFPATAWESAAFRTCQASIAGSWPLTVIPAGTWCGCPSPACPPIPRRCSCSMERAATADCSCARPAGEKRRHRNTSSQFSQRRSNISCWRHSVSRHAGTTTAFRPRSTPISGRPAILRPLPGLPTM